MPQDFETLQPGEVLASAYDKITGNFLTLQSGFAGDTAPASVVAGQTFQVRKIITHADLTAAATSEVLSLFTTPTFAVVLMVYTYLVTPFSGGGATVANLDVGDSVVPARYDSGRDLFTGAASAMVGNQTVPVVAGGDVTTATTIDATFTADVDVADLTAGEVQIVIVVRSMIQ